MINLLLTLLFPGLPAAEVTRLDAIELRVASDFDLAAPAAPARVSKEKIQANQYTDVNRALRQTPGVYVREEEGQGLRPNIGLRGTNPDRSKKVVILEDGVLIGPAPYSAPAAYYTPFMNGVESLEVYRGFTAIPYGPNSIGGAVNYVSPSLAERPGAAFSAQGGSFGTRNWKLRGGGPVHEGIGGQVQASQLSSDGFKEIDGGGDAGFRKRGVNLLLEAPVGDQARTHRVRARLGWSDERSYETYVGLTLRDFERFAYRRYAASALDRMRWQHGKAQLEHEIQVGEAGLLRTTVYRHQFHRAWYRLDRFAGDSSPIRLTNALKSPTGSNQPYYDVLSGRADSSTLGTLGNLVIANNDRDYLSQGVQSKWMHSFATGPLGHELELSARVHFDRIRRHHTSDQVEMVGGRPRVIPLGTLDARNEESARARTASLVDSVSYGPLTLTGAARFEHVAFETVNHLGGGVPAGRSDQVFVPGVGLLVRLGPLFSVAASVNKAVTVAGLDASGGYRREQATNYESTLRYANQWLNQGASITAFRNAYGNITGTCTASSGCGTNQVDFQYSGGRARIQGIEAALAQGLHWGSVRIPLALNLTMLHTRFESAFTSSNSEWGFGRVNIGDPLPYVPRLQYTFTLGMEYKKLAQELAVIFQAPMADQSVAAGREEIPAYGILDWAGHFDFAKGARFFAKVDNLLARNYLVSLKPYGARPGKPRAFTLGLSYEI